jgi:GNAT superfamily N-acetyltransferase
MPNIALAETDDQIAATFAVMQQLRTHLVAEEYVALVRRLQERGYLLAFLEEGGRIAAAVGFKLARSLAWGDFVYVDDLVTDDAARSCGHGSALLAWVSAYGKACGCRQLHLDSGVQRFDAHRFYLRERMDITCHHFRGSLE